MFDVCGLWLVWVLGLWFFIYGWFGCVGFMVFCLWLVWVCRVYGFLFMVGLGVKCGVVFFNLCSMKQ
jgi:hypothetical protein